MEALFTMKRLTILMALAVLLLVGCSRSEENGSGPQGDSSPVRESINSIPVPPTPDPVQNRRSLAGIDTDANGIRDDIDRRLAERFGADAARYTEARLHALRLQALLVGGSQADIQGYVDFLKCLPDKARLLSLSDQTRATLDTVDRRRAYGRALSGVYVTGEGC